jgi:hypothetical protein
MQQPLTRRRASHDDGVVVAIVALILIGLLVITAIVIDLGDAQQQKREAQAAADAGALAGAQVLTQTSVTPSACGAGLTLSNKSDLQTAARCVSAYDTFQSVGIQTNAADLLAASKAQGCGIHCLKFTSGKATVKVRAPWHTPGSTTDDGSLANTSVCWNNATRFGGVVGVSSIDICGLATARNTGVSGSAGTTTTTTDCSVEDNFTTPADTPTVYYFNSAGDFPGVGALWSSAKPVTNPSTTPLKGGMIVAAVYQSPGSSSGTPPSPASYLPVPSNVTFTGPTNASQTTGLSNYTIPLGNAGTNKKPDDANTKGQKYIVFGIDSAGKVQIYPTAASGNQPNFHMAVVAYMLPDDAHLLHNVAGTNPPQEVIYTASLHVVDSDNVDVGGVPVQCGNATWTFTHDGHGTTPGVCGENSFLANGVFPSNGKASPGDTVGAYYSDESTIQAKDVTDPSWPSGANFGIDFELSGPGFTDSNGDAYQIPPSSSQAGGYTLTTLLAGQVAHPDKFNTKISWTLPGPNDPRWENGQTYTVFLKAYDTDNNKPGNDCGQGTWKYILTGATNGKVVLIQ